MGNIQVDYDLLYSVTAELLEKMVGYPKEISLIAAHGLVEADARGHSSHGVARINMYYDWVLSGKCDPNGVPEITYDTPISLVINGNKGPGFSVAKFAMSKTIEKAKEIGTCMTVVYDSSHFGMSGLWAEMAADEGMIGIALSNTLKAGIPSFGKERILGTNPICVAIPVGKKPHFMLDMATTTVSLGKIEMAARRGGIMPTGWAVDENGLDTTDALNVADINRNNISPNSGLLYIGGAGETLGGHKGYGLGLLVELLTSGLSLGTASYDTYQDRCGICHYFQATRMDVFGVEKDIINHIGSILNRIRNSSSAAGEERIYIHGEKEFEQRIRSMEDGVSLDQVTWDRLTEFAKQYNIRLAV